MDGILVWLTAILIVITTGCVGLSPQSDISVEVNKGAIPQEEPDGNGTEDVSGGKETPLNEQPIQDVPENPTRKIDNDAEVGSLNVTAIEWLSFEKVNAVREENASDTLLYDSRLSAIARYHSYSMAKRDFYSHHDPLIGGPARRMNNLGYDCPDKYGENIHMVPYNMTAGMGGELYNTSNETEIAEYVVDSWYRSPAHRAGMLDSEYEVTGVGIYVSERNELFVTMQFCG